mgnify:CR=1 FL=1
MCSTFCQCLTLYFSALIMEFVAIQKQAYAGIIEKKRRRCGKEGKNGLVYRKLSGRNDADP